MNSCNYTPRPYLNVKEKFTNVIWRSHETYEWKYSLIRKHSIATESSSVQYAINLPESNVPRFGFAQLTTAAELSVDCNVRAISYHFGRCRRRRVYKRLMMATEAATDASQRPVGVRSRKNGLFPCDAKSGGRDEYYAHAKRTKYHYWNGPPQIRPICIFLLLFINLLLLLLLLL